MGCREKQTGMLHGDSNIAEVTSWLSRARKLLYMDRAVGFALGSRMWTFVAGPITALLIVYYMPADVQGFYYTFGSLIALRSFFELGLSSVIVSHVSHEWARLRFGVHGELEGEENARARLVSIGRFVLYWYGVACLALMFVVGPLGWYFFSVGSGHSVSWHGPWLVLVGLASVQFLTAPALSILEGCNQVGTVSAFRALQVLGTSLLVWLGLLGGAELWVVVFASACALVTDLVLILGRFRRFFVVFITGKASKMLSWKNEIWPMQWRLGMQGAVSYFAVSLSNPVIFHFHGPSEAGRFGMTASLVGALAAAALVWMRANVPRFGMLVAQRSFLSLDRLAKRLFALSGFVYILGGFAMFLVVLILREYGHPLADRIVGPLPLALLLANSLLGHISQSQAMYLRAHRREPWALLGTSASVLTGAGVWFLGARFGVTGAAMAGFLVSVALVLPVGTWLFMKKRSLWRSECY